MRKWIWIAALLCCIGTTTAVADDGFKGGRTDFRDETIYFVITTRFYDGDETNNVMCWDNQAAQLETKDPCWRGDFKGLIERLDYIKALGFTAISDIPNANATNSLSSLLFPLNIYTLTGIHVATITNMSQLHQLQPGVYVAGKQKVVIR